MKEEGGRMKDEPDRIKGLRSDSFRRRADSRQRFRLHPSSFIIRK